MVTNSEIDISRLKPLLLKVEESGREGSAFLVRPNSKSKIAYFISAAHVMRDRGLEGSKTLEEISSRTITFKDDLGNKVSLIRDTYCHFDSDAEDESERYDLAIGLVDLEKHEYLLNSCQSKGIFSDEVRVSDRRIALGFPKGREFEDCDKFEVLFVKGQGCAYGKQYKNEVTVCLEGGYKKKSLYNGLSGGPVFLERGESILFYGVVTKAYNLAQITVHPFNTERFVELLDAARRKIIGDNDAYKDYDFSWEATTFLEDEPFNLESVLSDSVNENLDKINIESNSFILEVNDKADLASIVTQNAGKINKGLNDSLRVTRSIAEYYAYLAFRFYQEKDNWKSSRYMNKAVKLHPEKYGVFALSAKKKTGKDVSKLESEYVNQVVNDQEGNSLDELKDLFEITNEGTEAKQQLAYRIIALLEEKDFSAKEPYFNCLAARIDARKSSMTEELFFFDKAMLYQACSENRKALLLLYVANDLARMKELDNDFSRELERTTQFLEGTATAEELAEVSEQKNEFIRKEIKGLGGSMAIIKRHANLTLEKDIQDINQKLSDLLDSSTILPDEIIEKLKLVGFEKVNQSTEKANSSVKDTVKAAALTTLLLSSLIGGSVWVAQPETTPNLKQWVCTQFNCLGLFHHS